MCSSDLGDRDQAFPRSVSKVGTDIGTFYPLGSILFFYPLVKRPPGHSRISWCYRLFRPKHAVARNDPSITACFPWKHEGSRTTLATRRTTRCYAFWGAKAAYKTITGFPNRISDFSFASQQFDNRVVAAHHGPNTGGIKMKKAVINIGGSS